MRHGVLRTATATLVLALSTVACGAKQSGLPRMTATPIVINNNTYTPGNQVCDDIFSAKVLYSIVAPKLPISQIETLAIGDPDFLTSNISSNSWGCEYDRKDSVYSPQDPINPQNAINILMDTNKTSIANAGNLLKHSLPLMRTPNGDLYVDITTTYILAPRAAQQLQQYVLEEANRVRLDLTPPTPSNPG